jgi:2-oxoisovalerate dehydrogenase E1 component
VHWALEAQAALPHLSIEIVDLRTLLPWDKETVFESVRKTGKVLVLHEDCHTGGVGAEIAATLSEELFRYLDAPVTRLAALDTPVPFNAKLEEEFLPAGRLAAKLVELAAY